MPDQNSPETRPITEPIYPPFDQVTPYPKYLVMNIYAGYTITNGKLICITNPDQMPLAKRFQSAIAEMGFNWAISLYQTDQEYTDIGLLVEVKPLEYGSNAYKAAIEIYDSQRYSDGIIALVASDLSGLERGIETLIQIIKLNFEHFGGDSIASLWIEDWIDSSSEAI